MFKLRSIREGDLEALYDLSKLMNFLNLPNDKKRLEHKIHHSIKAFTKPSADLSKNHYLFVLEDTLSQSIAGVSMIHAQHGSEEEPHFFLKVGQEHKFSATINTGFVHGTLKLGLETKGPTEIGGLVLNPKYRGHKDKLGKQISFARFLYMANHPNQFKEMVHSELMPPFNSDGKSPLWEALGRRFMNMEYLPADKLSRTNKEFILNLFPADNIYISLLPLEARNAIGKVGKSTEPVKKMLESVGFRYVNEIDPFDGGPHFRCPLQDIKVVKNTVKGTISGKKSLRPKSALALVSYSSSEDFFSAVQTEAEISKDKIIIPQEILNKLKIKENSKASAFYLNQERP